MNDDISEILTEHKERLDQYIYKMDVLRKKITFCTEHKFMEEARVLRIEYDAMDMLLYNYKKMYEDINDLYK